MIKKKRKEKKRVIQINQNEYWGQKNKAAKKRQTNKDAKCKSEEKQETKTRNLPNGIHKETLEKKAGWQNGGRQTDTEDDGTRRKELTRT